VSFRLVPNSVTLDDLERRNSPQVCVILPNSVAFGAHYVKVVELINRYFMRQKCTARINNGEITQRLLRRSRSPIYYQSKAHI